MNPAIVSKLERIERTFQRFIDSINEAHRKLPEEASFHKAMLSGKHRAYIQCLKHVRDLLHNERARPNRQVRKS